MAAILSQLQCVNLSQPNSSKMEEYPCYKSGNVADAPPNRPGGSVIILAQFCYDYMVNNPEIFRQNTYGSGHETVAVLLPGFAINW